MSVVIYTAKREIEKLAYLKTGTDISAAAVDDSFNSVTTDLSGLLDDEWVEVIGLVDPANIGWFQANGASITTKITQDTSVDLVTEAAGPLVTIQGHVRGLDQQYSIEFTPRRLHRRVKVERNRSISIGGSAETILRRRDVFWDVNSGRLLEADLPQWREFLASIEGGESLTFDPYGTIALPDNPLVCELEQTDYGENRIGVTRRYIIPFSLRVIG